MSQSKTRETRGLVRFETLPAMDKRRVMKAAFLRPVNVMMIILGVFATVFFSLWFLPAAVVTYLLLGLLASRDPFFIRRVVGEPKPGLDAGLDPSYIQPERRARWLSRGETRERVEKTLEVYRELIVSIEESNDVTREVLGDAVPKLHLVANRLVEIAHKREKAANTINKTKQEMGDSNSVAGENAAILESLEREIKKADAEILETHERLVNLRSRVAYATITDDAAGRATAAELSRSLDNVSLRLEALDDTTQPPG